MANDDADDSFEVASSPASLSESPEFEGANVCRIAAISTMLGNDREAVGQLDRAFAEMGFSARIRLGDWNWSDVSLVNSLGELRQSDAPRERRRLSRWESLNETARPEDAVGLLVDILGSQLERESAAAAAALWRLEQPFDRREFWHGPRWWHLWDRLFDLEPDWPPEDWWGWPWGNPRFVELADLDEPGDLGWDPDAWRRIYERAMSRLGDRYGDALLVRMLSGWRLARALRSRDQITRSLAAAAFPLEPASDAEQPPATPRTTPPGALVVSTMIHGTWGWKGDWWRPRTGNFHDFILRNHRPNLYSRGARFSWSGAYRETHRTQAAIDFHDWTYEVAPHGVQSLFAHSYGGEVAARAALAGTSITELVLLSVPATGPVAAAVNTGLRVVDVRLEFDPILALARTRQRLTPLPNVTEVLLRQWRYDHGASHREDVWRAEDVARRGAI